MDEMFSALDSKHLLLGCVPKINKFRLAESKSRYAINKERPVCVDRSYSLLPLHAILKFPLVLIMSMIDAGGVLLTVCGAEQFRVLLENCLKAEWNVYIIKLKGARRVGR